MNADERDGKTNEMRERVRLVHWNAEEAKERAARLAAAGYEVDAAAPNGPPFLRALREDSPAALVVDLGRLPSQGRDVAVSVRQMKATRGIPLVFVGGDPGKVARVRELLPDAVYTDWEHVAEALAEAIAHPPAEPVAPTSVFAAYAGVPLAKKLGIKPNSAVTLLDAPGGFEDTVGEAPPGVRFATRGGEACALTVWFVRSRSELVAGVPRAVAQAAWGPVWIAWPKRGGGIASDVTQQHVREQGLAAGLVDYKVASFDATWSGLLFRKRAVNQEDVTTVDPEEPKGAVP